MKTTRFDRSPETEFPCRGRRLAAILARLRDNVRRIKCGGQSVAVLAVGLACLAWLIAGCVPTAIHPFYRASDVMYEPALLGVWKDKPDGKESWSFTPGEGKSYALEIQSDDYRATFIAHLFKLGDDRFLDIYPTKAGLEERLDKNPYAVALIPAHGFVRVRATEPALRMSCMGLDWLRQQLGKNPNVIDHVVVPDDRVVFTAGTEAMQAFIKLHLNNAEAWNDMYDDGLRKAKVSSPTVK